MSRGWWKQIVYKAMLRKRYTLVRQMGTAKRLTDDYVFLIVCLFIFKIDKNVLYTKIKENYNYTNIICYTPHFIWFILHLYGTYFEHNCTIL